MVKAVSYTKLESMLNDMGAQMQASETQGMLSGMLSVLPPKQNEAAWRDILLESLDCAKPNKQQWQIISRLGAHIQASLDDVNFSYTLLLPDDESPLSMRLDALAAWCRGYLSGLGLIGLSAAALRNVVVKELLDDIAQISRVSSETSASEEDESNYVELLEFLRIGVQNIRLELQGSEQNKMLH